MLNASSLSRRIMDSFSSGGRHARSNSWVKIVNLTRQTELAGCVEVADNGVGIPDAHRPKIFVAFQRLRPELAQGEGIGLALVRRVVERHGGRIWLESTPGTGSTFFVSLPAPAEDSTATVV